MARGLCRGSAGEQCPADGRFRDKNNGPERSFRATALEWVNSRLTHTGEVNGQQSQHLAKNRLTSCKDGRVLMPVAAWGSDEKTRRVIGECRGRRLCNDVMGPTDAEWRWALASGRALGMG